MAQCVDLRGQQQRQSNACDCGVRVWVCSTCAVEAEPMLCVVCTMYAAVVHMLLHAKESTPGWRRGFWELGLAVEVARVRVMRVCVQQQSVCARVGVSVCV